jgi:hypothetical protein
MLMAHWLDVALTSRIEACISSPGETVIEVISIEEFGKSSYQALYATRPRFESCSVPHCMSVLSFSNSPPMPIQIAENVGFAEGETVGTTHEELTLVTMD